METESSIWRRVGFKIVQALMTCHTFCMSFRTLKYMSGTGSSGNLDWDLVPLMLIFTTGYITVDEVGYLVFNFGLELNTKVYNESLKLRGNKKHNYFKTILNVEFEFIPQFD